MLRLNSNSPQVSFVRPRHSAGPTTDVLNAAGHVPSLFQAQHGHLWSGASHPGCICLASCTSCSTLHLMYKDAELSISHLNQQNSNTSVPFLIYSIGSCAFGSFLISERTKVNKKLIFLGLLLLLSIILKCSRFLFLQLIQDRSCADSGFNSWTECASRCGN